MPKKLVSLSQETVDTIRELSKSLDVYESQVVEAGIGLLADRVAKSKTKEGSKDAV